MYTLCFWTNSDSLLKFIYMLLFHDACFIVFASVCFFKVNYLLMYVNEIAAICLRVLLFHCAVSFNLCYVCSALMII